MTRRCKVLRVCDDLLIHAVLGWGPGEAPRYRVEGLPDGWNVERVGYNFNAACVEFLISHPSFAEVPAGTMFPVLHAGVAFRQLPGEQRVVPEKITFREFL